MSLFGYSLRINEYLIRLFKIKWDNMNAWHRDCQQSTGVFLINCYFKFPWQTSTTKGTTIISPILPGKNWVFPKLYVIFLGSHTSGKNNGTHVCLTQLLGTAVLLR
jgi:hypothetical protein